MNLVVDASVVVKWYIPERDHAAALTIRDEYLDGVVDLHAPSLLHFEVLNALRYSGAYGNESLAAAARSLADYGIEQHPLADVGPVADVATELDTTIYDASYVGLSSTLDATAYTADEALLTAASGTTFDERVAHVSDYG